MQKLNKLTLKQREELFRQLRISITHHSNAMEGTTLSFGETKELLEHGNTAGGNPPKNPIFPKVENSSKIKTGDFL